jgi:predicted RNase H-like nuclease
LQRSFEVAGFTLATADGTRRESRALLEVYPHAALMALLGLDRRFPYKVSRSAQYWPELSREERAMRLLGQWRAIRRALARELGPISLPLPRAAAGMPLASLKRYEDALDALVCAWVGTLYGQGRTEAFGDADSAIWAPFVSPGIAETPTTSRKDAKGTKNSRTATASLAKTQRRKEELQEPLAKA